jgi:hypothetical protein
MMIPLIPAVRWMILLLASVLTLLAVLEVYRIVEYARLIKGLAERTLPAARGVAANTAAIREMPGLSAPASRLLLAAQTLERTAAALEGRATAFARAPR